MLHSRIAGTGSYLPDKVITNRDLEKLVETSDEWISSRTGIRERRVASGESTSDMAVSAARRALKAAKVTPKDIDLIIVGTVTPDMIFPSTACFLQSALGARSGIPAMDVSAACSGFLYALDLADKYVSLGSAKKALVIGVDVFSRIMDWKDRSTCVLFGDGAGAAVLVPSRGKRGLLSSIICADGRKWEMLYTPSPIGSNPFEKRRRESACLKMQGNETFKVAVRTICDAAGAALTESGVKINDVSLLVPHQANTRIIRAVAQRLGLSEEQVFLNIESYGNTSAASIPIALDEAVRAKRINDGDIVLMVAFGGGLTWASAVVRW